MTFSRAIFRRRLLPVLALLTVARLDPQSGKIRTYRVAPDAYSHTPVMDADGDLLFTQFQGNKIGRLDTATGKIREYPTAGQPYGIALDRSGQVWFSQFMAGKIARLDSETGTISELSVGRDARPRRMAVAPDGSLWVALYAAGKLVRLDPPALKIVRTYDLPGGRRSNPYAVAVDSLGRVYVSATGTNRIL